MTEECLKCSKCGIDLEKPYPNGRAYCKSCMLLQAQMIDEMARVDSPPLGKSLEGFSLLSEGFTMKLELTEEGEKFFENLTKENSSKPFSIIFVSEPSKPEPSGTEWFCTSCERVTIRSSAIRCYTNFYICASCQMSRRNCL